MKTLMLLGMLSAAIFVPAANGEDGCVPGGADPSTYYQVDANGHTYYVEERNALTAGIGPVPIPTSGFLTGEGTWTYEETNGVPGLQRGGEVSYDGFWPPDCNRDFPDDPSNPVPC